MFLKTKRIENTIRNTCVLITQGKKNYKHSVYYCLITFFPLSQGNYYSELMIISMHVFICVCVYIKCFHIYTHIKEYIILNLCILKLNDIILNILKFIGLFLYLKIYTYEYMSLLSWLSKIWEMLHYFKWYIRPIFKCMLNVYFQTPIPFELKYLQI